MSVLKIEYKPYIAELEFGVFVIPLPYRVVDQPTLDEFVNLHETHLFKIWNLNNICKNHNLSAYERRTLQDIGAHLINKIKTEDLGLYGVGQNSFINH